MAGKKNRLSREASPYLRQHESNPVDWFPWGPEALERAQKDDKPILLSIGYSACHWCHVMAHESFESTEIAAKMNELFINVKVDREERPDLDSIYQLAVQVLGRNGGWPLTVFLTPEQKPFFAGTYFPPRDKYGMPGFPQVLDAIADAWKNKRGEVVEQADELTKAIARVPSLELKSEEPPASDLLDRAARTAGKRFDDKHGGFGSRPKFPNTMALDVLLRRSVEAPHDFEAEARVKRALSSMRCGGIYDHLGGGFHRYSTDEKWLVPHFEKMLYDNALLARLYVDAARAYHEPRFLDVAHDVLKWVAREMTAANGAFFSTQDADSVPKGTEGHAEEGAFFVWTPSDVHAALPGDEEAVNVAIRAYGVSEYGNFVDPHHEEVAGEEGRSVLHEASSLESVAQELGMTVEAVRAARERAARGMFKWRDERPKPFRDEKILASWNGLMIGACAEVAIASGDTAARAMAERAFEAVEQLLFRREGELLRVMRVAPPPGHTGEVKIAGYLDDYAFLANAALDLYELTSSPRYAGVARELVATAVALFEDPAGGFFYTPSDGEKLITRSKDPFDHAIPSGVSAISHALLRLFSLDGDEKHEERARKTLEPIAAAAGNNPLGFAQSVIAFDRLVRGSTDVVVVGARDDQKTRALIDAVQKTYVPHRTLAFVDPNDPSTIAAAPALAAGKDAKSHAVAYVCRGRTCSPPVADAAALAAAIGPKSG